MSSALSVAAQKKASVKGQEVTYTSGGTTLHGYVAYNENQKGKRPAIIVVPEWWGNNDYSKMRARKLAELGYIAIAVDMYGDGKIAANPTEAQAFATPFYKDPQLGKARIEAAVNKIKAFPETDANKIAAIGYCFGGSMVLNAAKMGMDFKGVVSFHGGLATVPATKGSTTAKILVCHGGADKFITADDIKNFRSNLDSLKVPYTFIVYPGATHAFTNPQSTATGKKFNMPIEYNEAADKKSWNDMKDFFGKIF
jgi:dienelactone hydrolase